MAGPPAPSECARLHARCPTGRRDETLAEQRELWRIDTLFARYNLAACIKAALQV